MGDGCPMSAAALVSLKTTGFAIPALLEWDGPVVATSVKSDLLLSTIEARRGKGKVMVFDPTKATRIKSVKATPLSSGLGLGVIALGL
jgi:type IV secretion system protein VirD4